jgi:DNA-binding response OmpR family regulator
MLQRDNEVAFGEYCMRNATLLAGRTILAVEDDQLITLELTSLFESAGAQVIAARTHEQAVIAIERYQICGALLDHGFQEENVALFCGLLTKRQIPFMFYTGCADLEQSYPGVIIVQKPACADVLLAKMVDVIAGDSLGRLGCKRPLAA